MAFLMTSQPLELGQIIRHTRMMWVHEITKPLKMLSDEAFELIADEIFDIVFLDGEHRYDGFFRDIRNSLRVLKPGGLLMGHDSECSAHKCNETFLIDNKDSYHGARRHDGKMIHTRVVLALRDLFGKNFEIYPDSSV